MQLSLSIDEQDGEGGMHVAVLEAIIEEDYLGALSLRECEQVAHSTTTIAIDDEAHLGVLLLDLLGLIPDFLSCRGQGHLPQATALSLVATTDDSDTILLTKDRDE